MTTTATTTTERSRLGLRRPDLRACGAVVRLPAVVWAVVLSRLLVVAAGWTSAAWFPRVGGWALLDTGHVTTSFGAVGNILAGPFVRWDSVSYLSLAEHGYSTARDSAFFPLYPLVVHVAALITHSYVIAGVVVSLAAFAVALRLLHRLTTLEVGQHAADAAVLLLAFAPVSFLLTALYTESLYLALGIGAVYAARRERWAVAGLLAALASICRPRGILLVPLIAGLYLQSHRRRSRSLAWLLVAPVALAAFGGYLAARGYGWLAFLHEQTGTGAANRLTGPLSTVWAGARAAWNGAIATASGVRPFSPSIAGPFSVQFESVFLFAVFLLAVGMLVLVFRGLGPIYGVYSLLALLVGLSSQNRLQPLQGFDRYLLDVFPLWVGAGAWVAERRALRAVITISAALLVFSSLEFATWAHFA